MRYCTKCGAMMPDTVAACPVCGAVLPDPAPQTTETAQTTKAEQPPEEKAPSSEENAPGQTQTARPFYRKDAPPAAHARHAADYTQPAQKPVGGPLGLGGNLTSLLLFGLPLVGSVIALVWAMGGHGDPARQDLARAWLIQKCIVVAVAGVLVIGLLVVAAATFNTFRYDTFFY